MDEEKEAVSDSGCTETASNLDPSIHGQQPVSKIEIDLANLSVREIYQFYAQVLAPAILSSVPILVHRITSDTRQFLESSLSNFFAMLLPNWSSYNQEQQHLALPGRLRELWEQHSNPLSESLLNHFDSNQDGHISPEEVLNMTEFFHKHYVPPQQALHSWWSWLAHLAQEWPLLDWKLGVFVWRTFGGILFLLAILSIVPGRLHGWSARLLRWPVLGLTYFLIWVELVVYTAIRLIIRVAEYCIARPKHRKLRRDMAASQSYEEWRQHAAALDKSQKRNLWLEGLDDKTSYHYNWGFIKELIKDMRAARHNGDSILALAVIQQCTRLNVGGIMSGDLFSYSNTGEPKQIVKDFMQEVVDTLHWITEEAAAVPVELVDEQEKKEHQEIVRTEFRKEKDKLWKSLVGWMERSTSSGSKDTIDNGSHEGESNDDNSDHSTDLSTCSSGNQNHDNNDQLGNDEGDNADSEPNREPQHSETVNKLNSDALKDILPAVHRDQVLEFLKRARVSYGRTALCLSGGAMMGMYHFGVLKGLARQGILPHIISGTSAGSAIAALVCTRTDAELEEVLKPEVVVEKMHCFQRPWKDRLRSLWKNGYMFETEDWMEKIRWFTNGDMTFEEAFNKTGRIFCITLSSTSKKAPPVLLNYLSAPNVTIASAALASGAVPGFIPPVQLQYKDSNGVVRRYGKNDQTFFDGSIRQDIPISGLAEMLNCQFFIASQCNPHIVPFFFNPKGGVGRPSRWSSGNQEHSWRGGFLLAALEMYLKNDMKAKFVFLNEVEAAVGFTSTMMTQEFVGSTTIVPQVAFEDYFKLFSDPSLRDARRCFQGGEVAAYEHTALIKLHYSIADALDDCIAKLEYSNTSEQPTHTRRSSFETSIHAGAEVTKQSTARVMALPGATIRPLEQLITEAIRVKKGGDGVIAFGALSFDDDDFVPIDTKR